MKNRDIYWPTASVMIATVLMITYGMWLDHSLAAKVVLGALAAAGAVGSALLRSALPKLIELKVKQAEARTAEAQADVALKGVTGADNSRGTPEA